ncbi:hypothetical protein H1R20_g6778, partial [Candolleomyces eurysporus]
MSTTTIRKIILGPSEGPRGNNTAETTAMLTIFIPVCIYSAFVLYVCHLHYSTSFDTDPDYGLDPNT